MIHQGVILSPSEKGFDKGATTFATVYLDLDTGKFHLFYSGAENISWTRSSIGLATSKDGINFNKVGKALDSKELAYSEILTPVVFRVKDYFYMVFAAKPLRKSIFGRRLAIAYSDELRGPWHFLKELIRPTHIWEGLDIDLGPSYAKISEEEVLLYYSNVTLKPILHRIYGKGYVRRIGILKLKIRSPKNIMVLRYKKNPLKHLNGRLGSWNESLFCPGYIKIGKYHYLLPAASTYSVGFPYKQYVGLVKDSTPYFQRPIYIKMLINGPKEKGSIIPNIKSEIAIDTPKPIYWKEKIYLYYGVMDREDGVWKTALTIFDTKEFN